MNNVTYYIRQWQYDGSDSWDTVIQWCVDNLDFDNWQTNRMETIWFFTDETYAHFLLKWS